MIFKKKDANFYLKVYKNVFIKKFKRDKYFNLFYENKNIKIKCLRIKTKNEYCDRVLPLYKLENLKAFVVIRKAFVQDLESLNKYDCVFVDWNWNITRMYKNTNLSNLCFNNNEFFVFILNTFSIEKYNFKKNKNLRISRYYE